MTIIITTWAIIATAIAIYRDRYWYKLTNHLCSLYVNECLSSSDKERQLKVLTTRDSRGRFAKVK